MFQRRLLLSLLLIPLSALLSSVTPVTSAQSGSTQNTQPPPSANAAETKSAEALPTLEQVLEKYVQAIGGQSAVQAATSRIMKGTIAAPSIDAKGTIEIYAKAPNKQLTEMASSVLGASRTGFNGVTAWEDEDSEVKELTVFPKREADFYFPLNMRELYPRLELKGQEKLGNREAYRLEAPRNGNPKRWYFDTNTGLLLRTEVRNAEGNLLNREDYEDYRAIDGIQIPLTTRQIDADELEIIIKFSEVKHNVPLDDAKFEKPAAKSPPEASSLSAPAEASSLSAAASPAQAPESAPVSASLQELGRATIIGERTPGAVLDAAGEKTPDRRALSLCLWRTANAEGRRDRGARRDPRHRSQADARESLARRRPSA